VSLFNYFNILHRKPVIASFFKKEDNDNPVNLLESLGIF